MNPIELKSPIGDVYAYACGVCHEVCPSNYRTSQAGPPSSKAIQSSLENAENCCRCYECKAPVCSAVGRCFACEDKHKEYLKENEPIWEAEARAREDAAENSTKSAKDVSAAKLLLNYMSDLSEGYWCAGWLMDLEYFLWKSVTSSDREFGLATLKQREIDELAKLSALAGGWWYWSKEHNLGLFITLDEWLKKFEEHEKAK